MPALGAFGRERDRKHETAGRGRMERTMRKGKKRKGGENRTDRLEITSEGGWVGREGVKEQEKMFCVRDGGGKRLRSDGVRLVD